MIAIGTKGRVERRVTKAMLAKTMASGALEVLATPIMIAFMEEAAQNAIAPLLPQGQTSVGSKLNIEHLSPTPEGMLVWAQCEVTGVEGRHVRFDVTAGDSQGLIGRGTHERVVVDAERFLQKCRGKME
ncbi:MAG: thioesterase family protein [Christensenellaceae bacterium]|jgi:predicted thioesterase|nr:thioesterase family protein [Christensenellaceae bacterium]